MRGSQTFSFFNRAVPWTTDGCYSEEALQNIPQVQVGVFLRGRSVRCISDADFADITAAGYRSTFAFSGNVSGPADQFIPPDERVKKITQALINRIVRDANFRLAVYQAYDYRCAITGLRILDSAGNSEVHAAHILAVADGGPDVIQNGLALAGTVHWLFDHHLISLTDDHCLLVAADEIPIDLQKIMIKAGERICLPMDTKLHPHPKYVKGHRDKFNKLRSLA